MSPLRSRYGKELAEGMGVGQPRSMKLKNVHLPHPHPNGGFSDSSLGRVMVLPVHIVVLALGLSVVSTPAGLEV